MLKIHHITFLVRLIGGANVAEGRVEILHDGSWGTVCDDSWDLKDAEVVCRMLGFDGALDAPLGARFGKGSGSIFLDEVQCQGTEIDVERCDHDGIGVHNCAHNEDASVICIPKGEHFNNITVLLLLDVRFIILQYDFNCFRSKMFEKMAAPFISPQLS